MSSRQEKLRLGSSLQCQVAECTANLAVLREYHQRYRICDVHLKMDVIVRDNEECRFCQQCGRFHSLSAFDNNKRSCRERLLKHNARRRRRGSAPMHSTERSQATDEMEQDDEEAPATSDSKLQLVSTASDVPAQPPHQATIAMSKLGEVWDLGTDSGLPSKSNTEDGQAGQDPLLHLMGGVGHAGLADPAVGQLMLTGSGMADDPAAATSNFSQPGPSSQAPHSFLLGVTSLSDVLTSAGADGQPPLHAIKPLSGQKLAGGTQQRLSVNTRSMRRSSMVLMGSSGGHSPMHSPSGGRRALNTNPFHHSNSGVHKRVLSRSTSVNHAELSLPVRSSGGGLQLDLSLVEGGCPQSYTFQPPQRLQQQQQRLPHHKTLERVYSAPLGAYTEQPPAADPADALLMSLAARWDGPEQQAVHPKLNMADLEMVWHSSQAPVPEPARTPRSLPYHAPDKRLAPQPVGSMPGNRSSPPQPCQGFPVGQQRPPQHSAAQPHSFTAGQPTAALASAVEESKESAILSLQQVPMRTTNGHAEASASHTSTGSSQGRLSAVVHDAHAVPSQGMQQALEALALNQLARARLDSTSSHTQEQEYRAPQDSAGMCGPSGSWFMPLTRHASLTSKAEMADCGAAPGVSAPTPPPTHPPLHRMPHQDSIGLQAVNWDTLPRPHKIRSQPVQSHAMPMLTRGTGPHRMAGPTSESSRKAAYYSWSGPPASLAMSDGQQQMWPAACDHWSGTDESTVAARLATQQLADMRDQAFLQRHPQRSHSYSMQGHSGPGQPFLLQSRTSALPPWQADDSYSASLQRSCSPEPQPDPYCVSPDSFRPKEEMLITDGSLPHNGGCMQEEQQAALQRLLYQQGLVEQSRQVYEEQLAKQQQAYEELLQQQRQSEQARRTTRLELMQQRQQHSNSYHSLVAACPLPSVHEEPQHGGGNEALPLKGMHLPVPVPDTENQFTRGQRSMAAPLQPSMQDDQPLWPQRMRQHSIQPGSEAAAMTTSPASPARALVPSLQPVGQVSPAFMLTSPLPSPGLAGLRSPGGQVHSPNLTRRSTDIIGIESMSMLADLQPGDGNTFGSWLLESDDDLSTLL